MTYTTPTYDPNNDGLIDTSKVAFDPVTQSEFDSHNNSTDAHHAKFTSEEARDAAAAMLAGGNNVTVNVDDANDTVTISATQSEDTTLSDEEVQDIVGGFVRATGASSVTYDDAANELIIDSTDTTLTEAEVENIIYPVTEGNLDFDPATQAELVNHADLPDTHHVKTPDYSVVTQSGPYSPSDREIVLADASGGGFTVTLPSPGSGKQVTVKKTDSSNDVTVDTSGSQSIDGQSQQTLVAQYEAIEVASDGSNWYII